MSQRYIKIDRVCIVIICIYICLYQINASIKINRETLDAMNSYV